MRPVFALQGGSTGPNPVGGTTANMGLTRGRLWQYPGATRTHLDRHGYGIPVHGGSPYGDTFVDPSDYRVSEVRLLTPANVPYARPGGLKAENAAWSNGTSESVSAHRDPFLRRRWDSQSRLAPDLAEVSRR